MDIYAGSIDQRLKTVCRPWTFESAVDWFETEGSVFITTENGETARARVVVASQGEDAVIRSLNDYLAGAGFHPLLRTTRSILKLGRERKRSAECELLRNLEQECFLTQALPLLRTEKRRNAALLVLVWLRERRRAKRGFQPFVCPKLG